MISEGNYAVIFVSNRQTDSDEYHSVDAELMELAKEEPGFIRIESAENPIGITISYWKDMESIEKWKHNARHLYAKSKAKSWYQSYTSIICKVEHISTFVNNAKAE